MTEEDRAAKIAALNDAFRRTPGPGWMVTSGVRALGGGILRQALAAVVAFEVFGGGDDPWGEHDFGALNVAGRRLYWKIDYCDRDLAFGSPDPADPAVTRRVLTLMLSEEY
jgi:hypothetical protein